MTILYVLLAIVLLGVLVMVHEFGHFMAARLVGIEVQEFSIGFGPKLLGWKGRRGTAFSLRAIPLGGYCAFYGEDDAQGAHVDDARSYSCQSVWKRMFSVIMGPMMNFILAFVVVVAYYWIGGIAQVTGYEPYIAEVAGAGPAYSAGLEEGDVIAEINGESMLDGTMDTLLDAIAGYQEGDAPLQLTVYRGDTLLETALTPFYDEEEGKYRIGVSIGGRAITETTPATLGEAISSGWDWCVYAGGVIINALKNLVTTGEGLENTAGPVGVVSMVTQEVKVGGFDAFLNLLVVISINLGIMNLLPIPGLDGSRFLFMLLEAIRRKPVPPQKEAMVHLCGYVLLFGLMIFFTFRDVLNLLH